MTKNLISQRREEIRAEIGGMSYAALYSDGPEYDRDLVCRKRDLEEEMRDLNRQDIAIQAAALKGRKAPQVYGGCMEED